MKKIKKTGLSLIVLSAFIFLPSISSAQSNYKLIGEIETELSNPINVSIGESLITDLSISPNIDLDTSIRENLEVENNMGKESDFVAKNSFKVNSSGIAVMSSSQINSEADLDIFSDNVSRKNDEVANVNINSVQEGGSEVKVVYRHTGKFLGFIPVIIKSTTIVEARTDEETEVRSDLAWWSFLVSDKNYTKEDIESRIKNNIILKSSTTVNASAQAKAEVAEVVIAEVTAHANNQIFINN